MKIYFFTLIDKKMDSTIYPAIINSKIKYHENSNLYVYPYALTPDKGIANEFIQTRNMNKFTMKTLDISKDYYKEYIENNSEILLEYHIMNHKDIKDGKYIINQISVLSTMTESDCILYYRIEHILDIFNKILDIDVDLGALHYKRKIYKALYDYFLMEELIYSMCPLEEINYDEIQIDELNLFIKLFSNTFKKG